MLISLSTRYGEYLVSTYSTARRSAYSYTWSRSMHVERASQLIPGVDAMSLWCRQTLISILSGLLSNTNPSRTILLGGSFYIDALSDTGSYLEKAASAFRLSLFFFLLSYFWQQSPRIRHDTLVLELLYVFFSSYFFASWNHLFP